MFELRDMQLLVALARHRHFARAANECGISQPAFSMRIRNAEEQLGVSIVKRGNRFQGFTEEGEIILRRARKLLDDAKALEEEVQSARGAVSGHLTVGVVPTALAYAAEVSARLYESCPGVLMRTRSLTSLQIQQGLEDGSIDAGITYVDGISPDLLSVLPLYEEKYVAIIPEAIAPRRSGMISWEEVAALPLSLLEPQMQNRRILSRVFQDNGLQPRVVTETNAFTASLVMARQGFAATIVPEVLVRSLGQLDGTVVLPLSEPEVSKSICLVSIMRTPGQPTVDALRWLLMAFHDK